MSKTNLLNSVLRFLFDFIFSIQTLRAFRLGLTGCLEAWRLGGLNCFVLEAWKGEASYRLRAKMMLQRLRRGWLARLLRGIWWSVGALGGLLAASWEPLGASLWPLGGLLGALGGLLGRLGSFVGCQEGPEGANYFSDLGGLLGSLGALLGSLGGILGGSWEALGSILQVFWCCLGDVLELGKRL